MQDIFISLLICSISMSFISLIFLCLLPLLSKFVSAKWLYYSWITIIWGFIIPFRPSHLGTLPVFSADFNINGRVLSLVEQILSNTRSLAKSPNILIPCIILWMSGVILFLGYYLIRYLLFIKTIDRWSDKVNDVDAIELYNKLLLDMKIAHEVKLHSCSCIKSPMMVGLLTPRILLSPHSLLSKEKLYFILKHELTHYMKKDLWIKVSVMLATAIHWFNPVIFMIAKETNIQCEAACDERVINGSDLNIKQLYGETIVDTMREKQEIPPILSTNFYGGKVTMRKRISFLFDVRHKRNGVIIVICLLATAIITGAACGSIANTAITTEDIVAPVAALAENIPSSQRIVYKITYNLEKTPTTIYYEPSKEALEAQPLENIIKSVIEANAKINNNNLSSDYTYEYSLVEDEEILSKLEK